MTKTNSSPPPSCFLPRREKALEVLYSLIWRKEKKERELMFFNELKTEK